MSIGAFRRSFERHKYVFYTILGVLVLGLVIVYGGQPAPPTANNQIMAEVDGVPITYRDYQGQYNSIVRSYRQMYGENFEQIARMMNLEEVAFNSVKQNALLMKEADRLGIQVTDADVRQYIFAQPFFRDERGMFSTDQYRAVLANINQKPEEFEESVREDIKVQRARDAIRTMVTVSKAEVRENYKTENEKLVLDYVMFRPTDFEADVQVSVSEMQARFDSQPEEYIIPTRVKVKYAYLTKNKLTAQFNPTDEEVQAYYDANKESDPRFQQEEQVKARHILIKVEEDATQEQVQAARSRIETLREDALSGADFAELARNNSEDAGSGQNGGDLGFFGRGRMVPPFEQAAFATAPGEISDIVRSQFGFHVIKVEEKREGGQKTLAETRTVIVNALKDEQATARLEELKTQMANALSGGQSLDAAAQAAGVTLEESPYFEEGGTLADIPKPPAFDEWAFSAQIGENNGGMDVYTIGAIYAELTDRIDEHQANFDQVRDQIRDELTEEKAMTLAEAQAETFHRSVTSGATWSNAAATAETTSKTTREFKRGEVLPDFGQAADLQRAAFGKEIGDVSEVTTLENNNVIVYKVQQLITADNEQFETDYLQLKNTVLQQKQANYLSWYLSKLEEDAVVMDFRDPNAVS